MSTEKKVWKLWLHGKASEAMAAHEVWDMLTSRSITEDTLVERDGDSRGWTALRSYKEDLRWAADARPAIVLRMPPETEHVTAPEMDFTFVQVMGCLAFGLGLLMGFIALGMNITVTAETGREVNNIGLMNDRMVMMVASGFCALIGTIMMLMGGKRP